jgi:hypothetical protein
MHLRFEWPERTQIRFQTLSLSLSPRMPSPQHELKPLRMHSQNELRMRPTEPETLRMVRQALLKNTIHSLSEHTTGSEEGSTTPT